ncbi:hypothetical protein M427DRAFT_57038 [Gonapodya prolifera JEL478]|uniref:RRM Nup35-type domain-containing protein n=1 Tax=Gonapodya prolifera (strain JEL478) TaxID=1344416 RepID=A0A139AEH4_GONPJ|nr:hypothetical protein M427DRAFT_57038 [Gonapodya prolifera JEL478]|eukprot:KXS15167.1 hypothetical protein M427DRAFT_57038 [Gonapodya prolifera JEL478]
MWNGSGGSRPASPARSTHGDSFGQFGLTPPGNSYLDGRTRHANTHVDDDPPTQSMWDLPGNRLSSPVRTAPLNWTATTGHHGGFPKEPSSPRTSLPFPTTPTTPAGALPSFTPMALDTPFHQPSSRATETISPHLLSPETSATVLVFGYPPNTPPSTVLSAMRDYGEVAASIQGEEGGNWMYVVFGSRFDAQKAARSDGHLMKGTKAMIAVRLVSDPVQLRELQNRLGVGSVATSSGTGLLAPSNGVPNPAVTGNHVSTPLTSFPSSSTQPSTTLYPVPNRLGGNIVPVKGSRYTPSQSLAVQGGVKEGGLWNKAVEMVWGW